MKMCIILVILIVSAHILVADRIFGHIHVKWYLTSGDSQYNYVTPVDNQDVMFVDNPYDYLKSVSCS